MKDDLVRQNNTRRVIFSRAFERRPESGRSVSRLGLWRLASRVKRSLGLVLPALGLGEPFPVFFGMQIGLLATEQPHGATPLSVVHQFLPLASGIKAVRIVAVACNAISTKMLQPIICRIKGDFWEQEISGNK
jgi:hypothetical protein